MASEGDNSTFQDLVAEISSEERENMLRSMKKGQTVEGSPVRTASKVENGDDMDLSVKLKQQSIFKQFWYWLKAALSNTSVEEVFNKALVSGISREVERESPGLMDSRKKTLGSVFFETFTQLKQVAEFLVPYVERYEAEPGGFYALLGYIIMPAVGKEIEQESDPYQYSFDKTITKEMKASLLHKMDEILKNIPSPRKTEMYASVRSVEWLRQFVRLPYANILSRFTSTTEGRNECPFAQIKQEFDEVTKIICNFVPITDEAIQCLYLYHERKHSTANSFDALDDSLANGADFINAAAAQISVIKMFVQSVPVYKMAKVIFENSMYIPEAYGGGEDWLVRYKNQWRLMFERRWELWNRDHKKEQLKVRLMDYFQLANFPLFPYRPWTKVWGGLSFHYELTLGFINSFFKNEYSSVTEVLKSAAVEGEFSSKDNQVEFLDTVNMLSAVNDALDILASQCSASGEYGIEFAKYEGIREISDPVHAQLTDVIEDIEHDTNNIINNFGKACRSLGNLMGGILGEKVSAFYGPLLNFNKIHGRDNKAFREAMMKAKLVFSHAYELVQEIEPLDEPVSV